MVVESKRKVAVSILLIMCALMLQVSLVNAQSYAPLLRVSASNVYLTAGNENRIDVSLKNTGGFSVYEVKAILSAPATTPGISILDGAHKVFNEVEEQDTATYRPIIYVGENVPLGAYSLTLTVTYYKMFISPTQLESTTVQLGIVVDSVVRSPVRLDVRIEDPHLTAGEDNEVTLIFDNIGEKNVHQLDATITSASPYFTVLENSRFTQELLEVDEGVEHMAVITVSPNVPLGVSSLTVTASYEDEAGKAFLNTYSLGINIEKASASSTKLVVTIENPELTAGTDNDLTLRLRNIGDKPVHSVDVSLTSTSPYITVLREPEYLKGSLEPGESATLGAIITPSRSTPIGVYALTATVSYKDGNGVQYMETGSLGLSVFSVRIPKKTSLIVDDYTTQPGTIRPGDVFELEVSLDCMGASAYDVKAMLSFDFATGISPLSPTMVSIGGLEPGGQASTVYRLIVDGDVRAGQYPARLTLTYLDVDGMLSTLVETLTFRVDGIVEFMLINEKPLNMPKGSTVEFEADLLLIGTESVKFMTLEVVEDATFRRTVGSEEYVGAIDPDSPIPFDLILEIAGSGDVGEHNLTLRVTYTDDLNQEHEATIEVPVRVTVGATEEPSQGSTGGFWIWLRRILGLGP
jgi:hypothetical protein